MNTQQPIFHSIYYVWDNAKNTLTLHNKTMPEAEKIAAEFGFRHPCWYRPSTWFNRRTTVTNH